MSHEQIADRFGCAEEDEEKEEDDGDEYTGRGRGAPPAYAELSSHFDVQERAEEESGNGDAFFSLSRYIEGRQKEECGSFFSVTPLGRVLFWLCKC